MSRNINFEKRPSMLLDPGKLLQKARSLKPKRLGLNVFYVSSMNPDPKVDRYGYIVRIDDHGKIHCQCQSFLKSGICSHVTAVAETLETGLRATMPHARRTERHGEGLASQKKGLRQK